MAALSGVLAKIVYALGLMETNSIALGLGFLKSNWLDWQPGWQLMGDLQLQGDFNMPWDVGVHPMNRLCEPPLSTWAVWARFARRLRLLHRRVLHLL